MKMYVRGIHSGLEYEGVWGRESFMRPRVCGCVGEVELQGGLEYEDVWGGELQGGLEYEGVWGKGKLQGGLEYEGVCGGRDSGWPRI